MAADTHRPNATRPAVDWDKLEGPALSELTPRLYLLTRWRDYLRLLVDCTLRFSWVRARGHFFEGVAPGVRVRKDRQAVGFCGSQPICHRGAIHLLEPAEGGLMDGTRFNLPMTETEIPDYYEFLEISPQATQETIHRVYRYLATRYHPDSAGTGDLDKFAQLSAIYKVLSDNAQRATHPAAAQDPLSTTIDFMDQVEGDQNRRLAVLAILYYRRRMYPSDPEVSLPEIERRMGFPRDYLDFTTWYLTKKRFITRADNSDFTLTVEGVDFIETQRATVPLLDRLLTTGSHTGDKDARNQLPAWLPPPHSPSDLDLPAVV